MRRLNDLLYPWDDYAWPLVVSEDDPDRDAKLVVRERLEGVERELLDRLQVQANDVIAAARASNEHLLVTGEPFSDDAVEGHMKSTRDQWNKVVPKTMELLQRACKAVDDAAGTKKLEECIAGLEQSQRFGLAAREVDGDWLDVQRFDLNFVPRDFTGKPGIKAYLGCGDMKYSDFVPIEVGWMLHVENYRPPASPLSPPEVR